MPTPEIFTPVSQPTMRQKYAKPFVLNDNEETPATNYESIYTDSAVTNSMNRRLSKPQLENYSSPVVNTTHKGSLTTQH